MCVYSAPFGHLLHVSAYYSLVSRFVLHVSDAWEEVNRVLNHCGAGINHIQEYEASLFEKNIITPPNNYGLFELEQTLLSLGSAKDATLGVFYFMALPADNGDINIRYFWSFLSLVVPSRQ